MVMLIPVLALITVLTCALATSVYLNVRQFTTAHVQSDALRGELYTRSAEFNDTLRTVTSASLQSMADQAKLIQTMQQAHAKQLTMMATQAQEQLRLTLADNSQQLREAVRIAWAPSPTMDAALPGGSNDRPYTLPIPQSADEAVYDDGDPTDDLLSEFATGRHQPAVIASDGDLVTDGKYLGIPGLVPPPGVLDDEAMAMLDYSARLIRQGQGASPQGVPPPPPGNVSTPQFIHESVGG